MLLAACQTTSAHVPDVDATIASASLVTPTASMIGYTPFSHTPVATAIDQVARDKAIHEAFAKLPDAGGLITKTQEAWTNYFPGKQVGPVIVKGKTLATDTIEQAGNTAANTLSSLVKGKSTAVDHSAVAAVIASTSAGKAIVTHATSPSLDTVATIETTTPIVTNVITEPVHYRPMFNENKSLYETFIKYVSDYKNSLEELEKSDVFNEGETSLFRYFETGKLEILKDKIKDDKIIRDLSMEAQLEYYNSFVEELKLAKKAITETVAGFKEVVTQEFKKDPESNASLIDFAKVENGVENMRNVLSEFERMTSNRSNILSKFN